MSEKEEKNFKWQYCPHCGVKFPDIENLKFCTNCGIDLDYFREHGVPPPQQAPTVYATPQSYYPSYRTVLSEEEVLDTKGRKLWGNIPAIGLPLLGFIVMNGLILGVIIALILLIPDDNVLMAIITNPLLVVFATLAELILIIIPLWYIKKYLKNPNLENRLALLGFTTKEYDQKGILREILIGIGFAVIGLFLVAISSLGIELFLRYVLGVRIIREPAGSDAGVVITGMDIFVLVLMVIMMLVIVGPCEEILFRGFMQRALVRNLGDKWGILITAIIFAAIHLVGLIIYIFNPIIFGILFIYLFAPYIAISLMLGLLFRWRDENLIAVIVTHGVYNSLTLIIAFLFYTF
jgi:hypothetical protein